jgi:hypothetical protein
MSILSSRLNVIYHNYFQFFFKNDFELKSELCGLAIFFSIKDNMRIKCIGVLYSHYLLFNSKKRAYYFHLLPHRLF